MDKKNLTISGKRKTAIAKATIKSGNGKITINKIASVFLLIVFLNVCEIIITPYVKKNGKRYGNRPNFDGLNQ